jgi:hypothetical protein
MGNYFTVISKGKGGEKLGPHYEKSFLNLLLSVRL